MILRALSLLSFFLGLAFLGVAAARELFGVAFGPPSHPYLSLVLVNIPATLILALIFFAIGAILGRKTVQPGAQREAERMWSPDHGAARILRMSVRIASTLIGLPRKSTITSRDGRARPYR